MQLQDRIPNVQAIRSPVYFETTPRPDDLVIKKLCGLIIMLFADSFVVIYCDTGCQFRNKYTLAATGLLLIATIATFAIFVLEVREQIREREIDPSARA